MGETSADYAKCNVSNKSFLAELAEFSKNTAIYNECMQQLVLNQVKFSIYIMG